MADGLEIKNRELYSIITNPLINKSFVAWELFRDEGLG